MDLRSYFRPTLEILEERNLLSCCIPTNPNPGCDTLQGWQNSSVPTNIRFVINGQFVQPPPGGILNVPPGANIGVYFTSPSGGTYSLGCYVAPSGIPDLLNDFKQVFYGGESITVGPGQHYMQISVPTGSYFQIDFYRGCLTKVWDVCALENWCAGACIGGWWGNDGGVNTYVDPQPCTCFYCQEAHCDWNYNNGCNQNCYQATDQYFYKDWQEDLSCCHDNGYTTVVKQG